MTLDELLAKLQALKDGNGGDLPVFAHFEPYGMAKVYDEATPTACFVVPEEVGADDCARYVKGPVPDSAILAVVL